MKFISYQDKKIAYQSEGKGTAVVLVHGFCEDSNIWEDFRADLLEENYRVIRIDLPGFGRSEVVAPITIEQMAEAVHAVLLKLNIKKVVFIGHSMGGYAGLAFARLYPQMLTGLGLFHSHPYADSEEKKDNRRKSIDFIKRQGHVLFVKQLIPGLFNPKFANSNAFLIEKLTYRAARGKSAGIIAAQQAMIDRKDETQTLAKLEVPVLFIIGEEDPAVPPESAEQIHLPQTASIHILEKVGHMGLFEARKQTQRIVRQFIAFCEENAVA
ncbi:MAG: alpha/beta hydrolase [Phaeodactylibacter sp.]|nr:alpha/beta hydrolase [Phaeodactylibacter sp.]MCB9267603.1 alpha/beta hydrolase [Lewinellaceae bacterium]MCB9287998.1 alpha/beta hydrolase [Lewinellaceae bacterium]